MPTITEKECGTCGARYRIEGAPLAVRDRDQIICECCGEVLHSWNAAVAYYAELIGDCPPCTKPPSPEEI